MSTTPKQKHVGWVIVTPKGKALRWTIHFIKDDTAVGDSAWGLFCDYCEEHRIAGNIDRTADGYPVLVGTPVFAPWFKVVAKGFVRIEYRGLERVAFVEMNTHVEGRQVGLKTLVSDCYFTLEAAEAAARDARGA